MSAIKGFAVLGSIAAIPLGLAYAHTAMRIGTRASNAYARGTGIFARAEPQTLEQQKEKMARREEIRRGIRSELEWLHETDLTCTL
ncbi:hypothetical protein HII31_01812 [Pseudocercospora fuligena]|uniref:Uncharacterized protein n=1 Tax=Pseudocercospora fuligena TaxID=685502 RepID=A0A8H6RTF7_9PEZI|nr:hypothetical protein HII31_01812 [Pseudocercospora fuligena]